MNLYYIAISGADFETIGCSAIDKKHAAEIAQQRISDYGYTDSDRVNIVAIRRAGKCTWPTGNSLIYG